MIFFRVKKEIILVGSSKELKEMIDKNREFKSLLEKAIEEGKRINPNKTSNPVQNLDDFYIFINHTQYALPHEILSNKINKTIHDRIDQGLNYIFYISDLPLEELNEKGYYKNSLQYHEPYSSWLKNFALEWGKYLDSEESWNEEYYKQFLEDEKFGLKNNWYESSTKWKTFNQFFSRYLISPDARPITEPNNNYILISPSDCLFQGVWNIDSEGYIIQKEEPLYLKSKHFSSIQELLSPKSKYINSFNNGVLTHGFLDVYDYHRFHFPISGKIMEINVIESNYAVGGEIEYSHENDKYILKTNVPDWQSIETRGCIIIETKEYGLVALLPIGMMPVTSIQFEKYIQVGNTIKKGDMLGTFLFGGSDFVILFQNGVNLNLTVEHNGSFSHTLMGQQIGTISTTHPL